MSLATNFFRCELRKWPKQPLPAELIYNYARCELDASYRKRAHWNYVFFCCCFLTETSWLAGSFIFVHIDLKLSVKVEKFLQCL